MQRFLAFDIETSGDDILTLSESQQEYILRRAETDEEKEQKIAEMALSPLTSKVVCIGMKMIEAENGEFVEHNPIAYSLDPKIDDGICKEIILGDTNKCFLSNEKTLLENFWKIFKKYPDIHLISFNGRNFDAPFLMLRSAKLRVRPSKNLMAGTKFNYPQHTDLIDELCFYMPTMSGATRRYNFDFFTRAFGITSPKSEGVNGSMVTEYFKDGKIDVISEYCLRDVKATWELYRYWVEYLKF